MSDATSPINTIGHSLQVRSNSLERLADLYRFPA